MTTNNAFPTLSIDPSGAWEFILPTGALPDGIAQIDISIDGIYIERTDGEYDLVPWDDIVTVMVPARGPVAAVAAVVC